MKPGDIITIIASIGFIVGVITFIAGFRMVRRPEQMTEVTMHKVNGIASLLLYLLLILASLFIYGVHIISLVLWMIGLGIYILKILLVKRGLAIRYGGYFGFFLLGLWIAVIFLHLPT